MTGTGIRALRRHAWLVVVAGVVALALLPALVPALRPLDDGLADVLFRLRGGTVASGSPIAVVGIDEAALARLGWPWSEATLAEVVARVRAARPRAVILTFPPPVGFRDEPAAGAAPLVRPLRVELTPLHERPYRVLEDEEPAAVGAGVDLLPAEAVVRHLPLFVGGAADDPDELAPSLLGAALAVCAGGLEPPGPEHPGAVRLGDGRLVPVEPSPVGPALRVNYLGGPQTAFGILSLAHLLDGQLDGELEGRIVLLGPVAPAVERGVATPTTERVLMPRVEVHAHALDTALRPGRALAPPPAALLALVLACAALVQGFFVRQLRPLVGAGITLALPAAWVLAASSWLGEGVLLPITPALLAFGGTYIGLAVLRAAELDLDVAELTDELARLDKRFYIGEDDVDESASRWRRALDLASMFVDVESLLLLRVDPEAQRLEPLAGHHTTDADIAERRRDMRRAPWREAADPTRRIVRPGFMKPGRNVSSFLVPIIAVNRPLGFLVVNRAHQDVESFARDDELIRFIAQQLGILLRREQLRRPLGGGRAALLRRLLQTDRLSRRFVRLSAVTHSILEKKNLLVSTLDAVDDGVCVCDLFGRVTLFNHRLGTILERAGLSVTGRNMVDLIHDVSGLERADVIRRFSGVVMGRPLELLLELGGAGGAPGHYRFALSAIKQKSGPLLGLVALFTDVSSLKELDRMKTNLLNMVSYRALNILTSIQGYSELLLEAEGLVDEELGFVRTIHRESMSLAGVFDAFEGMANLDLADEGGLKLRPIDLVGLVREVWSDLEGARGKDVTLDLEAPERFDVVAADRALIQTALAQTLGFAVDNADRGSTLGVAIALEERFIRLDVRASGFGMPADAAQALFAATGAGSGNGSGPGDGSGRGPLASVKEAFEVHGGTVKAEGAVGEGLRFHLWLPLFMKG